MGKERKLFSAQASAHENGPWEIYHTQAKTFSRWQIERNIRVQYNIEHECNLETFVHVQDIREIKKKTP